MLQSLWKKVRELKQTQTWELLAWPGLLIVWHADVLEVDMTGVSVEQEAGVCFH